MNKKEIKGKEVVEVEQENVQVEEKKIELERIRKLKCDFNIFKTERKKANMRVPDTCDVCGRSFEDNDNVYVAWGKDLKEVFVCKNCAEGEEETKTEEEQQRNNSPEALTITADKQTKQKQ